MSAFFPRRRAQRDELGLTPREYAMLVALTTPREVQAFVSAIPINYELGGETVLCVRDVLQYRRAHCIEGAFVAACALWIHGDPPLVMHLDCDRRDYPHVVALYRRNGYWGAISKSNGAALRFRDPVYRSLRELAMSYLHEYCDTVGRKTLRSYSRAFDLRRVATRDWLAGGDGAWATHDRLAASRHYPLVSKGQARGLAPRDRVERDAARLVEHPRSAVTTSSTRRQKSGVT